MNGKFGFYPEAYAEMFQPTASDIEEDGLNDELDDFEDALELSKRESYKSAIERFKSAVKMNEPEREEVYPPGIEMDELAEKVTIEEEINSTARKEDPTNERAKREHKKERGEGHRATRNARHSPDGEKRTNTRDGDGDGYSPDRTKDDRVKRKKREGSDEARKGGEREDKAKRKRREGGDAKFYEATSYSPDGTKDDRASRKKKEGYNPDGMREDTARRKKKEGEEGTESRQKAGPSH